MPSVPDALDPEDVPVGQRVAGLGDQLGVVLPADDQVTGRRPRALAEVHRWPVIDQPEVDQVVADQAGQFPAVLPGVGHQQRVLACQPPGNVCLPYLVERVFAVAAGDPAVLGVLLQGCLVSGAQAQAGVAFPFLGEPHRHRELGVPQVAGQHRHAAAGLDGRELLVITGQEDLAVVAFGQVDDPGQVGHRHHRALIDHKQRPRRDGHAPLDGQQELRWCCSCP